jgi:hypothetical protein
MAKDFIVTKEHRRFAEFATAVRKEHAAPTCRHAQVWTALP